MTDEYGPNKEAQKSVKLSEPDARTLKSRWNLQNQTRKAKGHSTFKDESGRVYKELHLDSQGTLTARSERRAGGKFAFAIKPGELELQAIQQV